jgi:NADH-quinone oxidoreductase subunit A
MPPDTAEGLFSPWHPGVFSLMLYTFMVGGIILLLLFLSRWLGQRRPSAEKLQPYESGILPTGQARLRWPVPFYLVAIFFLIFDIEGAFLFSWAVANQSLGWTGWFRIVFFIIILLVGLIYVWANGGLDWGPNFDKE